MSTDKKNKNIGKILLQRAGILFPPALFLVFTFGVYMPSSLFLGNINEFALNFSAVLPLILLVSAAMLVFIYLIGLVMVHEKVFQAYVLLIFSLGLGFYLQGNFLNPSFKQLNGSDIDWSAYTVSGIISVVVWIICIVVPQVLVFFQRKIMKLAAKWVSLFITGMQFLTLIVLVLTTNKTFANDFALTKNGEFELSSKDNTIVFVVDTLDATWFEDVIASDSQYSDKLQDFTYFDNAVAGGAPTVIGIPTILTGQLYMDTSMSLDDYYKDAYSKSTLFRDLQDNDYQVKIYTEYYYLNFSDKENVDNMEYNQEYVLSSHKGFLEYLYKFVSFYSMPQCLKQHFWFYSGDFSQFITLKDKDLNNYTFDDPQFYKDFCASGITTQNKKNAFVMYHLTGAHAPYTMNADAQAVPENSVTLKDQIQGSFKIIFEYIDEMKKQGVYDNSTIIIMADHGGVDIYQNPAILIKEKNSHKAFSTNSSQVSFINVNATIASSCLKDYSAYGDNLFDVGDKDVVRYHAAPHELGEPMFPDSDVVKSEEWTLYIIPKNARDTSEIQIIPNKEHGGQ